MTTKTIPAYSEDERQKGRDAQLRTEEEAERIQLLHHGHHRTPNQSKLALPSRVEAVGKAGKSAVAARKKPGAARKLATKVCKGLDSSGARQQDEAQGLACWPDRL